MYLVNSLASPFFGISNKILIDIAYVVYIHHIWLNVLELNPN